MNSAKSCPGALFSSLAEIHGTPFWVLDASIVEARIREVSALGFDAVRYAQKACSNLHLLRRMREMGVVVDAVSEGEIERALRAGFRPDGDPAGVVYTSDIATSGVLRLVQATGMPVNAGSIDMIDQLAAVSAGHDVWLRINPGFGHGHSSKTSTGGPSSKHGIWHADLAEALERVRRGGLRLAGLHVHIGSGADFDHLARVAGAMVDLVRKARALGFEVPAVSGGGGLPIPYRAGEARIDLERHGAIWREARPAFCEAAGRDVAVEIEPGRYLVAEAGWLVAEVRAVKVQGEGGRFVLVDAGFNDLVRPSMYGSWHEIDVLAPDGTPRDSDVAPTVVAGPLCESGDVFTQIEWCEVTPRRLPLPRVGDLVVFHDTGAYGAAMSGNYNSRPLLPEILIEEGEPRLVRRRQTIDDLLSLENV